MHRRLPVRLRRILLRTEPDEIDDLEDTESVDDEYRDEPPFLAAARSIPKGKAFQDNSPKRREEEKRDENTHVFEHIRGVEGGEDVHILRAYHTLSLCGTSVWITEARK